MQNEITELQNQIRRMRIINYSFYTVFALAFIFVWGFVVAGVLHRMEKDIFWNSAMIIDIKDSDGIVRAKKFEVVNEEGKVVASLYANMGGGMLSFSNKDGEVVAGLGSDEVNGGGVLGINNKDGKTVAGIYADENGGVARVLNNKFTEVAGICATPDGGGLKIFNNAGKPVSLLSATEAGAEININNKHGIAKAIMAMGPDGGQLMLFNNENKIFLLPNTKKSQ
jgi:hypothetical protein